MTTENYVSFETAKLLDANQFYSDECTAIYDNGDYGTFVRDSAIFDYGAEDYLQYMNGDEWKRFGYYLAPTLQMAMKWLREEHHLFIGCGPRLSFTDFYWITANIYRVRKKNSLYHAEPVDDYHCVACCDSDSFEGACEAAIKYCLENLI